MKVINTFLQEAIAVDWLSDSAGGLMLVEFDRGETSVPHILNGVVDGAVAVDHFVRHRRRRELGKHARIFCLPVDAGKELDKTGARLANGLRVHPTVQPLAARSVVIGHTSGCHDRRHAGCPEHDSISSTFWIALLGGLALVTVSNSS